VRISAGFALAAGARLLHHEGADAFTGLAHFGLDFGFDYVFPDKAFTKNLENNPMQSKNVSTLQHAMVGFASGSRVHLPIKGSQERQSLHGQAVLIPFAFDVSFREIFRQAVTDAPRLGTVCKGVIDAQRAVDGQLIHGGLIHGDSRRVSGLRGGKPKSPYRFRKFAA
jgi:hypothetical protein